MHGCEEQQRSEQYRQSDSIVSNIGVEKMQCIKSEAWVRFTTATTKTTQENKRVHTHTLRQCLRVGTALGKTEVFRLYRQPHVSTRFEKLKFSSLGTSHT
jgi:hypothetical protein